MDIKELDSVIPILATNDQGDIYILSIENIDNLTDIANIEGGNNETN